MIVKTRAWNKKVGEMIYPYSEVEMFADIGQPDLLAFNPMNIRKSAFEDYEFMLSTGAMDVNGVEIYEGDIVEGFGVVVWDHKEAQFGFIDLDKGYDHEFNYLTSPKKVIANIYENVDQYEATPYFKASSAADAITDRLKKDPGEGYWIEFSSEISLWKYSQEAGLMHKRIFSGGTEREWTTYSTPSQARQSLMAVLQRAFDLPEQFKKYTKLP